MEVLPRARSVSELMMAASVAESSAEVASSQMSNLGGEREGGRGG
jgi:hypothetical protein